MATNNGSGDPGPAGGQTNPASGMPDPLGRGSDRRPPEIRYFYEEVEALTERIEVRLERLRPAPDPFVGRADELVSLSVSLGRRGESQPRSVITGPEGIGKTALALAWANHDRQRYPGGQFFIDLRGSHRTGESPLTRVGALDELVALLVSPMRLRHRDEGAKLTLLREAIAGRGQILIILDDVAEIDQIEPVLGIPQTTLLITSRNPSSGLITVPDQALPLAALPYQDARALIARRLADIRYEVQHGGLASFREIRLLFHDPLLARATDALRMWGAPIVPFKKGMRRREEFLNHISFLESLLDVAQSTATETVPVVVYLDSPEHAERVERAVEDVAGAYGLRIIDREPPVVRSWFRRMSAKFEEAGGPATTRRLARELDRAVELRAVDQVQAQVDSAQGMRLPSC